MLKPVDIQGLFGIACVVSFWLPETLFYNFGSQMVAKNLTAYRVCKATSDRNRELPLQQLPVVFYVSRYCSSSMSH